MKKTKLFFYLIVSSFYLGLAIPAYAATVSTTTTTIQPVSGSTTTQLQTSATASQTLIDQQNALWSLMSSQTTVPATAPAAPKNLSAAITADQKVSMTWSPATGGNLGVWGYNVFRNAVYLATVTGATCYIDKTAVWNNVYSYGVTAFDASNNQSAPSNVVCVPLGLTAPAPTGSTTPVLSAAPATTTTSPLPVPTPSSALAPTAPKSLVASTASTGSVSLSWIGSTGGVLGVQGYDVFRNGSYIGLSKTTSYADNSAVSGTTYSYYIRAYDASNNLSASTNGVTIKAGSSTMVSSPTPTLTTTSPTPSATGALFAATSFWNAHLPATRAVNSNSANLVNELIRNTKLATPWINTTNYSTPLYYASSTTAKVPVSIVQNGQTLSWTALQTECQKGVPIPVGALPASGLDATITIYDRSTDTIYEFWQLRKDTSGKWTASWGGILKNASTSSGVMPTVINSSGGQEFWGATATGLPAIGGTILIKELQAGVIPHALAFAIPQPKNSFVSPATRSDGGNTAANAIPEGTIFKFPSTVVINPAWSPIMKMMVTAIRDYGMVLRDKSGSVNFYAEDPTQYGTNPYPSYYGGLQLWDVMAQLPWNQLQALA